VASKRLAFCRAATLASGVALCALVAAAEPDFTAAAPLFKQFCFDCHNSDGAEGQINLEQLTASPSFNVRFRSWEKVTSMLESGRMPPADMRQPTADQRRQLAALVRTELRRAAETNAGDPGQVVLRRLTSAEYAYTIQDLTGLDLDLDREFVSDAAGGEGFTNVGTVQFLDDSGLERYLEAAKRVADHAVIGSGPLQFFSDPGKTGLELSAIHRVRQTYRDHGFRTAAGEGGVPFGLDHYPRAFFAAWRYQHRERLAMAEATLAKLATEERLAPQFVEHVWSVLTSSSSSFPTSEIVAQWRALPQPTGPNHNLQEIRAACDGLYQFMNEVQVRLARAVGDEEEAPVLSENSIEVRKKHAFVARFAWMMEPPTATSVQFSVLSGDPSREIGGVVVWRNPRLRFRRFTRRREEPQPLISVVPADKFEEFAFGKHPRGGSVGENDFVTVGAESRSLEMAVPEGARGLEVLVDVEMDLDHGEDCVVRCSISEGTDTAMIKTVSALLANAEGAPFKAWQAGVQEFARLLPQVSHREPAPSDRDPIPFPFDNAYNEPERDFFHIRVKYHRDDRFLMEKLLDDPARQQLDAAWADLVTSFEYHDILLRFIADKYNLDLPSRNIASLSSDTIAALPTEVRPYVRRLRDDYLQSIERRRFAESRHVGDAIRFAERAWRRPLTGDEQTQLSGFYDRLRREAKLEHDAAVRSLLARILVAPQFLYRAERPVDQTEIVALSDWELASRLSYFLWSSLPDDELRRAAAAGELRDSEHLARQARRMLRDPKARRFATEFFGQWLGFYQFDRFRGIDPEQFPEFNDALKAAMYDEASTFFEHIVREYRPLKEILLADYAFVNADLARHYAIDAPPSSTLVRRDDANRWHRGGLLSLGAIHTVTSAPLRTSPVKRGDWVLRRILGTPVPPPPANAGSIAADDSPADGKTVRQRLEAHRHDATCANCHARIDPLGFALEHFDLLGRWRETYRNGEPIEDALTLGDGTPIKGYEGLRQYLGDKQDQFHDTLCTKLLAYALGRGELASDRELVDTMMADVRQGEGAMADLVVSLVTSRQFRHRRSPSAVAISDSAKEAAP
jgi:hypothetical protein